MKNLRRVVLVLFLVALVFAVSAVGVSAAPSVSAYSAVVMDADTGVVYFEKGADTKRAQASMTKLMTAYMIFEEIGAGRLDYDSVITIGPQGQRVAYTGGYSNVPLNRGEQYTVDTMLKLILLPSACGACAAMGEAIDGSEAAFVADMNKTAAELGLNARFANTYGAGVGMPNHYITARSQAQLAQIFIEKYPDILKYTSLNSVRFKGVTYYNTNHFLNSDYYAGVDGMKTGTSGEAGGCITVSAEKNGRRIIVVVMKSGVRYSDARKLLDYGFACVEAADQSLKNAAVSLNGVKRDDIRVGADMEVCADLSNLSTPAAASGYWTVNGNKTDAFTNVIVTNGTRITAKFDLDEYATEDVTIGFVLTVPDGTEVVTEKVFPFSEEEPCAFRDIDGHWAEAPITNMKTLGVFNGYGDGTFCPQSSISRGEFITALMRTLDSFGILELDLNAVSGFEDCDGHWADPYIAAAKNNGITTGLTETTFAPENPISRQEIATFLARAFELTATADTASFTDSDDIADWALAAVIACAENNILNGYPEGNFAPTANATRAEAAKMLDNILKWYEENTPPVEEGEDIPEDNEDESL